MQGIQTFIDDLKADRRDLFLCRVVDWPVSVKQLAKRTGLCEATIRAWQKRTRNCQRGTIRRIHAALIDIARSR